MPGKGSPKIVKKSTIAISRTGLLTNQQALALRANLDRHLALENQKRKKQTVD